MAARSPASKSASSSAHAKGKLVSLKSEKVSRVFSRSRAASIKQVSAEKRSRASRRAAPRQLYFWRSSIRKLPTAERDRRDWRSTINIRNQQLKVFITALPESSPPVCESPKPLATRNPEVLRENGSPAWSADRVSASC